MVRLLLLVEFAMRVSFEVRFTTEYYGMVIACVAPVCIAHSPKKLGKSELRRVLLWVRCLVRRMLYTLRRVCRKVVGLFLKARYPHDVFMLISKAIHE